MYNYLQGEIVGEVGIYPLCSEGDTFCSGEQGRRRINFAFEMHRGTQASPASKKVQRTDLRLHSPPKERKKDLSCANMLKKIMLALKSIAAIYY